MSLFDDEFAKLNHAQKEAVQETEGPVLVIAGPGTGKTQLLSMRVANIMRVSDADASNILCLTFTNKAATNMRDRLLKLVGPESNKVTVKTFHGFAAELMNANPDYFWSGAKLSTAPDATQLEIVQNILAKLPLSNPLSIRFAGQYTATDDVLKALRLVKEAGLTPGKLKAILTSNTAYIQEIESQMIELLSPTLSAKKLDALKDSMQTLPEQGIDAAIAPLLSLRTVILESLDFAISQDDGSGKTKHTGKWKTRWVQTHNGQKGMFDEQKRNNWWVAFGEVYEEYRTTLHTRGYYDYSDMLLEVIVQLEQQADLRADIQERYQYVLIDEFQDSNAAQLRLAHLVANHHTNEGAPNIMAVGDDDQSIFGFNGAELNNMLFFERSYTAPKRIVLHDNYRSSQALLETAEKIINQAEDRLVNRVEGISKTLIARNEPAEAGQIQHLSYKTQEHQYSETARLLHKLYNEDTGRIAVLARSHESLRQLSALLLGLDIPISYEQQTNILDHAVIKQVIILCELLCAINQGDKYLVNKKVAELIKHPMWKFTSKELWQLATDQYATHNPDWLLALQASDTAHAGQLASWLQWLARESAAQPLYIILEYLLGLIAGQHMTSPIREYYLTKHEVTNDYLHGLSAVRLLRELVTEFSSAPTESASRVADFVDFITINKQNNRGITDESPFVMSGRTIELYTVHKAKGLEFDQVIIIDAVEDAWKPRTSGRKPPANLPLQPPGEKDDDYIRLLYVAATRAKRSLYVTSYQLDSNGNDMLPTPFIRQAIPEVTTASKASDLTVTTILEENLRWPRLDTSNEKALLQRRLTDYSLSATHMLTFLDVANNGPEIFLEKHILGLPEAKTPLQGFGIAMHSAMQLAQKLTNQDAFKLDAILKEYGRTLQLEHLLRLDYEKYLLHGQDTLRTLFKTKGYRLQKDSVAEQQFRDIPAGEAILSGTIDRIDNIDGGLRIVDYKTGQPLASFTTRDQTKAVKAWRHKYQLIFYTLLARQHPAYSSADAIDAQVVYLEAETEKELTRDYQPSDEEITRVYQLVQVIWTKINNLDFPDTSGYSKDIAGIAQFEEDLLKEL